MRRHAIVLDRATYSAASSTCGSASSASRPYISCGRCSAMPSSRRWSAGSLAARLEELRGRRLRCHCPPGAPRHSDVLVRLFCENTAVLEVGVVTSVGSACAALGGRREASAAVLGVGVVTPVGAAKSVRAVPAASLQSSSSSLGGRCEAAAVPEVGVVTSVGSASSVRACPAAAQVSSHKTATTNLVDEARATGARPRAGGRGYCGCCSRVGGRGQAGRGFGGSRGRVGPGGLTDRRTGGRSRR